MEKKKKVFNHNIIDSIHRKRLMSRYLLMIGALLISAIVFNLFMVKSNLVTGGINGIAIICKHLYHIEPSTMMLMISLVLLVLSFIFLGFERTSGTIVATLIYPFFVKLTKNISSIILVDSSDLFLVSVFIGIIGGIANGIIYKTGFSNGGLPIISQILYKKLRISQSKSALVINGIIVFIGGLFFGWNKVLYALIILLINSYMMDKILLGISRNKAFYIITKKKEEVKKYIHNHLEHDITILNIKEGMKEKEASALLTVIPTKEYFLVTTKIQDIDPDAFFLACDIYQVKEGK